MIHFGRSFSLRWRNCGRVNDCSDWVHHILADQEAENHRPIPSRSVPQWSTSPAKSYLFRFHKLLPNGATSHRPNNCSTHRSMRGQFMLCLSSVFPRCAFAGVLFKQVLSRITPSFPLNQTKTKRLNHVVGNNYI